MFAVQLYSMTVQLNGCSNLLCAMLRHGSILAHRKHTHSMTLVTITSPNTLDHRNSLRFGRCSFAKFENNGRARSLQVTSSRFVDYAIFG